MTLEEYLKVRRQLGNLIEIQNEGYRGLTIENIRKQLVARMKYFEESDKGILIKPIVQCNFSVRALNCLKSIDVETVADLVEHTKLDLLRIRNCGRKTITEINDFLHDNKLELRR